MRVTPYVALAAFFAACPLARADWILRQAVMADMSKANTTAFTKKNSTVVSITGGSTNPVATVKFNSYQASIGQDFSTVRDWSAYNIVDFYIANKTTKDATLKFITQFKQDPDDYTNAWTGTFTVYANTTRHFVCFLNTDDPLPYGLKYLNPVLTADSWEVYASSGFRDLKSTWHWRLSYQGSTAGQVEISNPRLLRQSLSFTKIADQWGQYTDRTWPGKITSNNDFAVRLAAERSDNTAHPGPGETTGTTKLVNPTATLGKWSVVTYSNGSKFLQHPNGKLFWSMGVNAVLDSLPTRTQDRSNYFYYLPDPTKFYASCYSVMNTPAGAKTCYSFRKQNLMTKYGSSYMSPWTTMVKQRLASWGINTLGIDCKSELLNSTIPFTYDISTTGFSTRVKPPEMKWGTLPDPYASGFLSYCQTKFKSELSPYVNNQNLMGVFTDNELSWGTNESNSKRYNIALGVLASPSTQPAKVAFISLLTSRRGTISALNSAWGTNFSSFSAIQNSTTWKPTTYTSGMIADFSAFCSAYAAKYFTTVRSALSYAGLKSLYLGCRFADHTYEVVNASVATADVVSFNVYRFRWDVPFDYYNTLAKPVLISEFGYTLRAWGTFGGPASMPGASGRAYRIDEFLRGAITQRNVVGAHYYCYADQPITGRYSDYENGGFGIVDIADQPYADSVNVFRNFTSQMYNLRATASSGGGGVASLPFNQNDWM